MCLVLWENTVGTKISLKHEIMDTSFVECGIVPMSLSWGCWRGLFRVSTIIKINVIMDREAWRKNPSIWYKYMNSSLGFTLPLHMLLAKSLNFSVMQLVCKTKVVVVQSLSRVHLFVTPWTVAHQASFTIFRSSGSVMLSNHLIQGWPHYFFFVYLTIPFSTSFKFWCSSKFGP